MGDIERLLKESAESVSKMTPVERELMLAEQARSWTRGNMGLMYPHLSKEELERLVPRNILADEIERLRAEADTAYLEGVKAGLEAAKEAVAKEGMRPHAWDDDYGFGLDRALVVVKSIDPATITRKGGADGAA